MVISTITNCRQNSFFSGSKTLSVIPYFLDKKVVCEKLKQILVKIPVMIKIIKIIGGWIQWFRYLLLSHPDSMAYTIFPRFLGAPTGRAVVQFTRQILPEFRVGTVPFLWPVLQPFLGLSLNKIYLMRNNKTYLWSGFFLKKKQVLST